MSDWTLSGGNVSFALVNMIYGYTGFCNFQENILRCVIHYQDMQAFYQEECQVLVVGYVQK